jgi:hypothetical protein
VGWIAATLRALRLRTADPAPLGDYCKHGRLVDAGAGAIEQTEQRAAHAWLGQHLRGRNSLLIVDTNEQADRLCAAIRAGLVALGCVSEHGVPLRRQGTWAGYACNRRSPVTRENYHVLEVCDDGGLVVTRIRDESGERITPPRSRWSARDRYCRHRRSSPWPLGVSEPVGQIRSVVFDHLRPRCSMAAS